ncbi:uncharacterized protein MELLADRAFT_108093 [Melampsora larici-populina 98AG31]|uniref:Uncharacterized protein n=1 Tax=Melampsora larici-populina (strain 98AG31 / pathotype 3-4-7) TaxID=747676 RepID=F4RRY6_MELLP|nr:uncharacterized protein MELLADRAFT_108093 [Melampsora larici-populina 98AG31]EGG04761.1 hypothetical protein MELLADRAFT_108093 [Melampsora larici-populina 98AG31]
MPSTSSSSSCKVNSQMQSTPDTGNSSSKILPLCMMQSTPLCMMQSTPRSPSPEVNWTAADNVRGEITWIGTSYGIAFSPRGFIEARTRYAERERLRAAAADRREERIRVAADLRDDPDIIDPRLRPNVVNVVAPEYQAARTPSPTPQGGPNSPLVERERSPVVIDLTLLRDGGLGSEFVNDFDHEAKWLWLQMRVRGAAR